MSSHDKVIYLSALGSDCMMVNPEPFESDNFDVRSQFMMAHTEPTSNNTVDFGLLGLANQNQGVVSNCTLLRVRRGSSNNVQLLRVRNSDFANAVVLATGSATVNANEKYWVRLVCVAGGKYTAYVSTSKDWGTPVFTYVWSNSDYPCPIGFTTAGKGQCGIYARIQPLSFKAKEMDGYSTAVPVSSLGDFTSFPSAGKIFFDGEYMSYGSKTSGTSMPTMHVITDDVNSQTYDIYRAYYEPSPGYVLDVMTSDMADYTNYLLWFAKGGEAGASWKITSCDQFPGELPYPYVELKVADTGHANTNYITSGQALFHEFTVQDNPMTGNPNGSQSRAEAYILPGLLDVVRGQNNTTGTSHNEDTVRLYEGDEIQVFQFEVYDHAEDLATEDLLRMSTWLAGVESEFIAYDSGTQVVTSGGGTWGTPVRLTNNAQANLDIRASVEIADGQSLGFGFRFDGDLTGNGFIASIEHSGEFYYAYIYDSSLALLDKHRFEQVPTGPVDLRICSAIRVAGDPGTFIAIYVNKMVYTGYIESYAPHHGLQTAFMVARGSGDITVTYRIPEFGDWREAVYLDPNSDGQGAVSMVIAERIIKIVSRSGEKLKFSAFDDYGASVVTLSDVVVEDEFSQEDADIFSYMHVEADNIKEAINPNLMAVEGMLLKSFSMPRLIDDQAKSAAERQLRYAEENATPRSINASADPRLENEDKLNIGYTTQGSVYSKPNQDHIVSDITFTLGPAVFDMKLGVRKWVDDTVR